MQITYTAVRRIALVCLMLPCLIFFLGFLRPAVGIPAALMLLIAAFFAMRPREGENGAITLAGWQLPLLFCLGALWCFLAGIGNFYYQSEDWAARNALLRDLIRFEWPVIYANKNSALVYYVGYWLPAALVGKSAFLLGATGEVAFGVGNVALFCWSALCVFTVFLLLLLALRATGTRKILAAVAIFILFSGLDILGTLCNAAFMGHPIPSHIEWWAFFFQFSSNTTALFWVFNQAVPSFLATLTLMQERTARSFAFLLLCTLASSPFASVGLGIYMLGIAAVQLWQALKKGEGKRFSCTLFTPQNCLSLLLIPIFLLYYKTNLAFSMTRPLVFELKHTLLAVGGALLVAIALLALRLLRRRGVRVPFLPCYFLCLLLFLLLAPLISTKARPIYYSFLLLECGVYFLLLFLDCRRDPLYCLTLPILLLSPLVVLGTSADFAMRASLPAITVLSVLCIRVLFANAAHLLKKGRSLRRVLAFLLVIALALGALTPIFEVARGVSAVCREGKLALVNDSYYTLSKIFPNGIGSTEKNFIGYDYANTFFFKYLAGRCGT